MRFEDLECHKEHNLLMFNFTQLALNSLLTFKDSPLNKFLRTSNPQLPQKILKPFDLLSHQELGVCVYYGYIMLIPA